MSDQTAPDPATFDVHPIYVLIGAAKEIKDAETRLRQAIASAYESLDRATRDLDRADRVNGLGILQGQGPAVDVAAARLEGAASALSSLRSYLHGYLEQARLITDPSVKYASGVISLVEWFDAAVADSPRASAIWESRS